MQQSLGQDFKIAKLLMNFILTEIPTLNSGHSYEAGCPTKEKSIRASPPLALRGAGRGGRRLAALRWPGVSTQPLLSANGRARATQEAAREKGAQGSLVATSTCAAPSIL